MIYDDYKHGIFNNAFLWERQLYSYRMPNECPKQWTEIAYVVQAIHSSVCTNCNKKGKIYVDEWGRHTLWKEKPENKSLGGQIYTSRSHIIPWHRNSTQNFPPKVPSVLTDDNALRKSGNTSVSALFVTRFSLFVWPLSLLLYSECPALSLPCSSITC